MLDASRSDGKRREIPVLAARASVLAAKATLSGDHIWEQEAEQFEGGRGYNRRYSPPRRDGLPTGNTGKSK